MHGRRAFLAGLGMAGLSGCATATGGPAGRAPRATAMRPGFEPRRFAALRAEPERISRITVCSRPFRGAGPRLDVETLGDKRVVHNYGHGGSGWSLAWGSGQVAMARALEGGTREVAVIGCGALGLTAALQILRAGTRVAIYAAERTPFTRSARATGVWSPSSRIAREDQVTADFPARWEAMTRTSWAMHHSYLGLDGDPVRFIDEYALQDAAGQDVAPTGPPRSPDSVPFIRGLGRRLRDLTPGSRDLAGSEHPFPVANASLGSSMTFNVAELSHRLAAEFLAEGGTIQRRVFNHPSELAALPEPVIVNCTGYGARALFGDESLVPIRGQIAWLVPQPEVDYALYYRGVSMVPRADGIVIQARGSGDMVGYGVEDETPDRAEAEAALAAIRPLFSEGGAASVAVRRSRG